MQTKTYTTEAGAKKAAARAYSPAIVRLANGRYSWVHPGHALPRVHVRLVAGALTGGVRTSSRRTRLRSNLKGGRV